MNANSINNNKYNKNYEGNLTEDANRNGASTENESPVSSSKPLGIAKSKLGPNDSIRSFNVGDERIEIVENSQRSFAITTGDALNLAYGVKPCEDYEIQNVIRDL